MQLVDIGANLGHESFAHDLDAVLARARAAGVAQMVVTGASREGSQQALTLAKAHPQVLHCTAGRSEEHTSELQSLMRISYAVFCLKKKRKNIPCRVFDQCD